MKEKRNLTFKYIVIQIGMWAMYAPLMGYTSVGDGVKLCG